MKDILIGFVLAIVLGVLIALHATNQGVLLRSAIAEPRWAGDERLSCLYFTGFASREQTFRYGRTAFQGRSTCPFRWQFDGPPPEHTAT